MSPACDWLKLTKEDISLEFFAQTLLHTPKLLLSPKGGLFIVCSLGESLYGIARLAQFLAQIASIDTQY